MNRFTVLNGSYSYTKRDSSAGAHLARDLAVEAEREQRRRWLAAPLRPGMPDDGFHVIEVLPQRTVPGLGQ